MIWLQDYNSFISVVCALFLLSSGYLLNSSQVLELSIIDLLLQHELLEVLSSIWLSLQSLQSLKSEKKQAHSYSSLLVID